MRAVLITAALLAAAPALAAVPVTLRSEILDADGVVTLGEVFDGAGSAATTRVATRAGATVVLDAAAVQSAARRAGLVWANAEGVRRIVVRGAAVGSASAKANVEVLTYARNLNAGEIVQPQDLVWGKVAAAPAGGALDAETMIGLAARRPLRAGAPASTRDVVAPQVVKAGDLVTVSYEDGGISLSLQAKAMGSAAAGDLVAVQNIASKKIVQAVAVAPGQAAVGPGALALRARKSQQLALR
jgi:flagellar basal body P-ring formation protein FlgA